MATARSTVRKDIRGQTTIKGLDELQKKFADLIAVANTEPVVAALTSWGISIRDTARANLRGQLNPPPETGNLEKSPFVDSRDPFVFGPDIGPAVLVGLNHNIAPHWHFFELGTTRQPARPFYRPAVAAHRMTGPPRVRQALRRVINDAAGGRPARVLLKPKRTPAKFSWK